MIVKRVGIKSIIIAISLSLGLVIGVFKLGPAIASYVSSPDYPVNVNGQTYGSDLYASTETEPDLVSAVGVKGTLGYVLSKDLYDDGVNTPEEAVAYEKKHASKSRMIPLYAQDGKTIIGQFEISAGEVQEKPAKGTD